LYDPYILHYTAVKPWFYYCSHPLKHLYYQYKTETQWANDSTIEKIHKSDYRAYLIFKVKKIIKCLIGKKSGYRQIKI